MIRCLIILPVNVWVWNLVAYTKVGTQSEGVSEYGAEENIWA